MPTASQATANVKQAANGRSVELLGRLGLASRGMLYLVMAVLVVKLALEGGGSDEEASKSGALRTVAEQPFGKVLLVVMAVGFAGYTVWRLSQAITADEDDAAKTWVKRIGYIARAAVYVTILITTIKLLTGGDDGGQGGQREETSRAFGLPFGRWLVLAAGLGFLIAAGYNGYRAYSKSYEKKWDQSDMSGSERKAAVRVASVGLAGHMVVFALVGFFLAKSALQFDQSEPVGLDESLHRIAGESWGTLALLILAVGLAGYAVFCFLEAKLRRMLDD